MILHSTSTGTNLPFTFHFIHQERSHLGAPYHHLGILQHTKKLPMKHLHSVR